MPAGKIESFWIQLWDHIKAGHWGCTATKFHMWKKPLVVTCECHKLFKSWVRRPDLKDTSTHPSQPRPPLSVAIWWSCPPFCHHGAVNGPWINEKCENKIQRPRIPLLCFGAKKKFKMIQIKYIKFFQEACQVSESEQMHRYQGFASCGLGWDSLRLSSNSVL